MDCHGESVLSLCGCIHVLCYSLWDSKILAAPSTHCIGSYSSSPTLFRSLSEINYVHFHLPETADIQNTRSCHLPPQLLKITSSSIVPLNEEKDNMGNAPIHEIS